MDNFSSASSIHGSASKQKSDKKKIPDGSQSYRTMEREIRHDFQRNMSELDQSRNFTSRGPKEATLGSHQYSQDTLNS